MRELTAAFVQEGGAALEASMAGMSPNDADRIASLCRRFNLHASMGSDFHDPAVPWNPLGRWLKLAAGLEPVTQRLTKPPMSDIEDQDNVDRELFKNVEKLRELRIAHRDLDEVISRLSLDFQSDQLQLKRLKKRKLILKDQITRLESELIPDLNAEEALRATHHSGNHGRSDRHHHGGAAGRCARDYIKRWLRPLAARNDLAAGRASWSPPWSWRRRSSAWC